MRFINADIHVTVGNSFFKCYKHKMELCVKVGGSQLRAM